MNPKLLRILFIAISLTCSAISQGEVIYSENFSNDPGYTSLAPEYVFWDSINEYYYVKTFDNLEHKYMGYSPKFAKINSNKNILFEVDINFENPAFGTYPSMNMYYEYEDNGQIKRIHSFSIKIDYSTSYPKKLHIVRGNFFEYHSTQTLSKNTWYHINIKYDSSNKKADILVTDLSTNEIFYDNQDTAFQISDFNKISIGFYDEPNYGKDWSPIIIDNINIEQEISEELNTAVGKIVTASEILGYSASVGGVTIKAQSYNLSTVTDINGDFQLSNIPVGDCIIQIESSYFQTITKSINIELGINNIGFVEIYSPICQNICNQKDFDRLSNEYNLISNTYLTLSSNYQELSSSYNQCKNDMEIIAEENEALKNTISSMFTQEDINEVVSQKDRIISQLNSVMGSMFSQAELDNAIIEARKGLFTPENVELIVNKILEWDVDDDGTIGLKEAIQALMISTGIKPIE